MNSKHRNGYWNLLSFASVLPVVSCTSVTTPKPVSATYAATEQIHLKVALNITDDLRKANWEQRGLFGGGEVMSVGPAVAEEAASFARHTFMDVIEVNNGSAPSNPIDAILTPKVPVIGRKNGQTMFSKDSVSIKLEWTLVDRAGSVLFADTISGGGTYAGLGWSSVLKIAL